MTKFFIIHLVLFIISLIVLISCVEKKDVATKEKGIKETWPPSGLKEVKIDFKHIFHRNYYIIFDGSGSMRGEKLYVAKKAVKKFINKIPKGSHVGLLAFDKQGNFERATIGSKRKIIKEKVDEIKAQGETPLGKSIEIAFMKLGLQAKKQLGYGEYNLVILTDGKATDKYRLDTAIERLLLESPIIVHTIGFKIGKGHPLNQPGKMYYKIANNYDELAEGLQKVLAELKDFNVKGF